MKIAWFTPFHKESAIGRYSKYAAKALSQYADVDLLIFEKNALHTTDLRTVYYDKNNINSLINNYDICIYNMGDNYQYHGPIFDALRLRRGIVIAHDICLHNFFRSYYISRNKDETIYYKTMAKLYGAQDALKILKAGVTFEELSKQNLVKYNMSEELIPYSLGFVVHSQYHQNIINNIYYGNICSIPLLYIKEETYSVGKSNFKNYPSGKLKILTVGNVNPNKHIHSIIEAIGKSNTLKNNVYYTVAGALVDKTYTDTLLQMIDQYDLQNCVQLVGYADDNDLSLYYEGADIVANLRIPVLEGASASLIEQMSLGKSIIVSNSGMYAEMPDDCVIKIELGNEVEQLINKLENILSTPSLYLKYGKNAKIFSAQYSSSEQYGKKLFDFIQSVNFLKPLYTLTDLISQKLSSMGVSSNMHICDTISSEIEYLYAKGKSNE